MSARKLPRPTLRRAVVLAAAIVALSALAVRAQDAAHVRGVEAVGFTVADMDRSVDFFSRVLDFEKVSDREVAGAIPLARLGLPEEVGALCAYLCSEQAAYMTGQTITIDGGLSRAIR